MTAVKPLKPPCQQVLTFLPSLSLNHLLCTSGFIRRLSPWQTAGYKQLPISSQQLAQRTPQARTPPVVVPGCPSHWETQGWDQLGAVGTLLWAHTRGSDHPTASWSEHSGAEAVTRAIGHSKRSSRNPKHPEGQLQQYRAGCRLLGLLPSPPAIFMKTFEQTKSTQHQHLCN